MNDKITLHELVDLFARKSQLSQADAALFAKEFLSLIEEALARDKYVKVKGLGTFKLITVDVMEETASNGPETTDGQSHTRVSFIPETGLKDLVNKPFAHFQPVLLKDEVHFTDLPEGETEVESQETVIEEEKTGETDVVIESPTEPATEETDEMLPQTEAASPIEEEPVQVSITEKVIPEKEEVKEKQEDTLPEKEERIPAADLTPSGKEANVPWCMIASILLAGIFIGGIVTWVLTSGRRYIPEQVVEKLMNETQKTPAPVVPDSLQVADTLVVKKDSSLVQKKDTLKTVAKKEEKTPVVSTPVPKRETLADTVEYQITGNQGSYTLKPGESLVRVALKFYGNKKLWPYLVKHNKAIIKNPDNVPVGTTIQIPQLTPKK
ncbi:HU family DNA-binding protein [Phocaeicola plebeius]|uniref:HU family DNA-binding protein n=1 Tax=Phocaeicola plebeius TaxID=310297 RepID=UPI00195C74AB|nr:HU family DNA-binding protein [Phocaeicola plebeius]MBM6962965.1 HU family DNA-binding protein [Phocaeicola plebeius]